MVAALVSALTRRPLRERVAMTGEITLSGQVLPVGGIKEKILAARRAGVTTIFLPAENEPNVHEDLSGDLLSGLELRYARTIREVADEALEKEPVPEEISQPASEVLLARTTPGPTN
jgi:ATP-dependent Lon protease